MRGHVNARLEPVLRLEIRGPGGATATADAVVDTGYNASLALPPADVAALGLLQRSTGQAVLGDGSVSHFAIYVAEVRWMGVWRGVLVSALGPEALVGTRLLAGHSLHVEVRFAGAVEVAPLP